MSRNDIFAELVNYYLFSGRQTIKPSDLSDGNSIENVILSKQNEKNVSVEKYRDIIKQCVFKLTENTGFLLIGVENQLKPHYAMPIRSMLYDALNYDRQIAEIEKQHHNNKDKMTGSEFLSGFTKKDRLVPVITLVVYFGQELWSAPKSLHEMLYTTNPDILNFITDYHINLIDPHQMSENDYCKMGTHLQYVMRFIGAANNKSAMKKLLSDFKNIYENLEKDAAKLLAVCTKADILISEHEEVVNMCKAWEDMREECIEQGKEECRNQIKAAIREIKNGYNTIELLSSKGFSKDTVLDAIEIAQQLS